MLDNNKKTILITGANGFVGKHLISEISSNGRHYIKTISASIENEDVVNLSREDFLSDNVGKSFFSNIDIVISLAGVSHGSKKNKDLLSVGNEVFLKRLLNYLDLDSVERFIYLSSYSVTLLENSESIDNLYAKSKKNCEMIISEFLINKSCSPFILRPVLIYGKGAKGLFSTLLKIIKFPIILPLGSVNYKRSFLSVQNLCSIITALVSCDLNLFSSKIEIMNISDPWKDGLGDFISRLIRAQNGKAIVINFPVSVMSFCCKIIGMASLWRKISLSYDIPMQGLSKKLSWEPVHSKDESFRFVE